MYVHTIVFCSLRGRCSRFGFFAAWRRGLGLKVSTSLSSDLDLFD